MTTPRFSRSAIAAVSAALGALGAIGVAQLAGASNSVMQVVPVQSSSDATTTTTAPGSAAPGGETGVADCERRGHGGHRHEPLDAETEAKVKAAAEGAVQGGTYRRGHKNHNGSGYKAVVANADGTKALVHMDNEFKVTSVEDPAPARGRGRGHGPRGDRSGGTSTTPTTVAS